MLGACVAVCYEAKQRRATARVEAPLSATFVGGAEELHSCRVIDLSEGGVALRSDRVFTLNPGELGEVTLRSGSEEHKFAVENVRTSENRIHLRFLASDLKHQRAMTKLIYARADSWLDWTKDQRRDRIISSLVHVFGIGAKGIWMLPSMMIKRESKAQSGSGKASQRRLCISFSRVRCSLRSSAPMRHNRLLELQPKSYKALTMLLPKPFTIIKPFLILVVKQR